jgi:hypothetical protein
MREVEVPHRDDDERRRRGIFHSLVKQEAPGACTAGVGGALPGAAPGSCRPVPPGLSGPPRSPDRERYIRRDHA